MLTVSETVVKIVRRSGEFKNPVYMLDLNRRLSYTFHEFWIFPCVDTNSLPISGIDGD